MLRTLMRIDGSLGRHVARPSRVLPTALRALSTAPPAPAESPAALPIEPLPEPPIHPASRVRHLQGLEHAPFARSPQSLSPASRPSKKAPAPFKYKTRRVKPLPLAVLKPCQPFAPARQLHYAEIRRIYQLREKFKRHIMKGGNLETADRIMRDTFKLMKQREVIKARVEQRAPIPVLAQFSDAFENVRPTLYTVSVKRGGQRLPVPTPLKEGRSRFMGMKFFMETVRAQRGSTAHEKLAREFVLATRFEGKSVAKKDTLHRTVVGNRTNIGLR